MDGVLLLALFAIFCCSAADAQIAPGPLSRAHADMGGITRCTSCHGLSGHGLKCFECHVEIKRRVEAGTGFHARAYKSSAGDCARCHAEHRGPKFAFVPLDRMSFDHGAKTGFILEGKHRELKCESCHNATRIAPAARGEIRVKDLNRSFLGLQRECTSCHQEPHLKQLGDNCLSCHSPVAWKPASRFSHSRTAFPLTGLHQQVPCEKCHARTGVARSRNATIMNAATNGNLQQKSLLFKGLSFSRGCQSCHADQHQGAFQDLKLDTKCERCHNTGGFKNAHPANGFDHSLTKFVLVGKHAQLPCAKCHKGGAFNRPIAHELCRDCHEDQHGGQFGSRAAGTDCSSCHNPTGFKPALFDREAHMRSSFPLTGKHSTLPCAKCHQPEGRAPRFKTGKRLCSDCHVGPHGGDFASEPYNNKCDLCHTEAGFDKTTFSIERHAQTRFPLIGRHTEVACEKCHRPLVPPAARTSAVMAKVSLTAASPDAAHKSKMSEVRRQFRFASHDCNVCHADPHRIEPSANLSCETCHTPQQWKAVIPFDHSHTAFKLEGSHKDEAHPITCIQCHKASAQSGDAVTGSAPVFSGISTQCSGCHAQREPHGGQFGRTGYGQSDCASCHAPLAWNINAFDHNKTRFTLNGSHSDLPCTKCHKEQKEANGRTVRMYRDTPTDCLKCH